MASRNSRPAVQTSLLTKFKQICTLIFNNVGTRQVLTGLNTSCSLIYGVQTNFTNFERVFNLYENPLMPM